MGDGIKGQLETEIELKSSPEQFLSFWKCQVHQAPVNIPSIQAVRVHEGDGKTSGSTWIWNYTIDGKSEICKEKSELDEKNKMVKLIGLEGDVFKAYKVWNGTYHVKPKGQGSLAKFVLEYEKLNPSVPVPHGYMDFAISFTTGIDNCLVNA